MARAMCHPPELAREHSAAGRLAPEASLAQEPWAAYIMETQTQKTHGYAGLFWGTGVPETKQPSSGAIQMDREVAFSYKRPESDFAGGKRLKVEGKH